MPGLDDIEVFVAVARRGGFRDAARHLGIPASTLSAAVRRLEERLGLRLLNRSSRSVALTEAGERMLQRLRPALDDLRAALDGAAEERDRPSGALRLNVPVSAARLVLPSLLPGFLAAFPEIRVEVTVEDGFVDVLAAGADAGIRYGESLAQDVVAVPIGPRVQRFAAAAAPAYLLRRGTPREPSDLLGHDALRIRFPGGAPLPWEFERDGRTLRIDPPTRLLVTTNESDLALGAAIAGAGVICHFDGWLRPALEAGTLVPVLEPWWASFPGPFLYYPGRRLLPPPLRAFVDYIRTVPRP